MKKILSIILALGLVLGVSLAALPVGAQFGSGSADWTLVTVGVAPDCELTRATYTIGFTTNMPLDMSFHVFVEFPAGTGIPATGAWRANNILINTIPVNPAEITTEGNVVKFRVPQLIGTGPITVVFQAAGVPLRGIVNPVAGKYNLFVKTDRPSMSNWVKSGWAGAALGYVPYVIAPTVSTYEWVLNFEKTYPGIGLDVVPPFKMCGQVGYGFEDAPLDRWVSRFDLTLEADRVGCVPCPYMAAAMVMLARPSTTARAHLYNDMTLPAAFNFTSTTVVAGSTFLLGYWASLPTDPAALWEFGFHFDTPGTYTFALVLTSLAEEDECDLVCADVVRIVDFQVYQAKDAIRIDPFTQKWNFFSSPLILKDGSIETLLAPVIAGGQLKHVVHYDNALGKWFGFFPGSSLPVGYQSLTEIKDGKGYAVRMKANYESFNPALVPYLWLFGNEEPEFPAPPLSYQVKKGWTMMGFTSISTTMTPTEYLYPSAVTPGSVWTLTTGFDPAFMTPGLGYWVYFSADGTVVPQVGP